MQGQSQDDTVLPDIEDLTERESLLFDVTNSQAYKAGSFLGATREPVLRASHGLKPAVIS